MTRFSHEPGMSEASEIVMSAAMYMDTDVVMTPKAAKFETNYLAEMFPSLSNFIDSSGDLLQALVTSKDSSLSTETPPSLVVGPDALAFNPGYANAMIGVMYNTFTITEGGEGDASNMPRGSASTDDDDEEVSLIDRAIDGAATIISYIPKV